MKFSILFLLVLLIGLVLYAWTKGPEIFVLAWTNSGGQLLRFTPIIVIAVLLAGFIETVVPREFIQNWLSDSAGWRGIVLAWFAGIITPIAGVFGMPLVAALYKAGAGLPVIMTYLTSLATLSLIKVPVEVGFYGWKLTMLRFAVSLLLPLFAGLLTHALLPILQTK
ncbi:permease [Hoeflea sp. TYP-13]|uniref:permease n=1 Tax=Hoeflea sp. TYP-13 TaxID=3230023 RepID=UPI0034C6CB73